MPRSPALALSIGLPLLLNGCYAAVGPTIGVDLPTGRATLGVEGSAETFTLAHSVALGTRPVDATRRTEASEKAQTSGRARTETEDWSSHTYLLWEPGFGGVVGDKGGDRTEDKFDWLGGGASVGIRVNRYAQAPMDATVVAGAWTSAGHALSGRQSDVCGASDTRSFLALVVGIRGTELYASPKLGVMHVPGFCLNLFDEEGSGF